MNLHPSVSCRLSSQLTLPEGTRARFGHSITSRQVHSGLIQTTIFGGSPKFERGKPLDDHRKIAETIVMKFGE